MVSISNTGSENGFVGTDSADKPHFQVVRGMKLCEEDAEDWSYRGEGAANIVLAYDGEKPSFVGRVLRIRKASRNPSGLIDNGTQNQVKKDAKPVLTEHEIKLWREWPSMCEATTSAALAHAYACEIMQPLLGKDHIDAGMLVFLTTGFLEAVSKEVNANQPEWRRKDAQMDMTGGLALMIADHSSFPALRSSARDLPQTITVELKPKWGFLPTAATISDKNNVKRHVPRFTMLQHLKLQQGKAKAISKYSPLDLFSGSDERIIKALVDLFETPQNNVRVFLEGEQVFGAPADGQSIDEEVSSLEEKLAAVSVAPEGERVSVFQRLVASALNKSKALDQLLRVQKLDTYDIEGAILAYDKFMDMADNADADDSSEAVSTSSENGKSINGSCFTRIDNLALEAEGELKNRDKEWIKSLTWEQSCCVVRNFLIAGTAKDCGLMLTLRPLHNRQGKAFPVPSAPIVACPTTGQQYIFKVAFLDLDPKRLKKMPFYHSLDQQIVDTYKASLT